MNKTLIHRTAPLSLPIVGILTCVITLAIATSFSDLKGNFDLTFHFGTRGLFQITIIAGIVIALLDRFVLKKKVASVLFYVSLIVALALGWIFAQSIIHY